MAERCRGKNIIRVQEFTEPCAARKTRKIRGARSLFQWLPVSIMVIVSMTAAAVSGKELRTLCLRVFQQQGQSATVRDSIQTGSEFSCPCCFVIILLPGSQIGGVLLIFMDANYTQETHTQT